MTDERNGRERSGDHATRGRRFKPHTLELADGSRLILAADGSIDHIDDQGSRMRRWTADDPDWPHQALRFGLRPQAPTVTPQGPVQDTRPPRR
jgi:hypothetical protein